MVDAEKIDVDSKTASSTAEVKTSIDILKKVRPSQNIAMEKAKDENQTKIEMVFENSEIGTSEKSTAEPASLESKAQKSQSKEETTATSDTTTSIDAKKKEVPKEGGATVAPEALTDVKKSLQTAALKNRSDIFSLNDSEKVANNIFSVTGVPSRTRQYQKTHQIFGEIPKDKTASTPLVSEKPVSTPSATTTDTASSTSKIERNPLTGAGVNSNDEFKGRSLKKKVDGNPVLGVGYKENGPITGNRIPPGGYSQGLW